MYYSLWHWDLGLQCLNILFQFKIIFLCLAYSNYLLTKDVLIPISTIICEYECIHDWGTKKE